MKKFWFIISSLLYFICGNILVLGSQWLFEGNDYLERNLAVNIILLTLSYLFTAFYLLYFFKKAIKDVKLFHIIFPFFLSVITIVLYLLYPVYFNYILTSGSYNSICISFAITMYLVGCLNLYNLTKKKNIKPTTIQRKYFNFHVIFKNWGIAFFIIFNLMSIVNYFVPFISIP